MLLAIDPVEELSILDRPAFGLRSMLREWGIRCHDMLIYDDSPENYDFFSGAYNLRIFLEKNNHGIVRQLVELDLQFKQIVADLLKILIQMKVILKLKN